MFLVASSQRAGEHGTLAVLAVEVNAVLPIDSRGDVESKLHMFM